MRHKDKKTMARKMRTCEELKARTPIFQTEAWEKRKESIKRKILKRFKRKELKIKALTPRSNI